MNHFIVFYRLNRIRPDDESPFEFECQADTKEQAKEQCLREFPDADVIHVHEYGEYYAMQAATESYWESRMQEETSPVIE